ncbi:hypothetical protein [Massilia sp. 9096]|nr:hypothetical protein [Massilia sp. 9096]
MNSTMTNRAERDKSGRRKLNRSVFLGLCLLALTPLLFYGTVALFFYQR